MKDKYIVIILLVLLVGIGVLWYGNRDKVDESVGGLNPQTTSSPGIVQNLTLLNATSTVTATGLHATSTPTLIAGAKKVVVYADVKATSTVTAVDFLIYVSPTLNTLSTQSASAAYMGDYQRFTDLVAVNGTAPTTADTYFARTAILTLTTTAGNGATSTAAMDLTYGTWRSMLCTASTTLHSIATCKVIIEY